MESHKEKKTTMEKKPLNKWAMLCIITLIAAFGFMVFGGYRITNFVNNEEAKRQVLVDEALVEHKIILEQTSLIITKARLKSAMLELQPKLDPDLSDRIAANILTECKAQCLDPALIVGLMNVESGFNPFTEGSKDEVGLMQIRYSIWKETPELKDNGVSHRNALFWIDKNVKAGTHILKKYYDEANCDMVKALYRYNTGSRKLPKNIDRWDLRYVNKVIYYTYLVKMHLTDDNKCELGTEIKEIKMEGEKL